MNRTGSNPNLDRARKIAEASDAEREAARREYARYVSANREIGAAPIAFDAFLTEWLSVRKVRLQGGDEPGQYERRDYSQLYRSDEK